MRDSGHPHERTLTHAFTAQADSFNRSGAANDRALLDALLQQAAPRADQHWLEAACGPGVISRSLAPYVAAVHGIDLTPAMVELAQRSAVAAGLSNATFTVDDVTATGLADDSFDAAITRFSLHHIPAPGRVLDELARVVRPGGAVVVADHLADEDGDAFAWSAEIERLRDPSHWASLTAARLRALGLAAGLRLTAETVIPIQLDLEDWVRRGTTDADTHRLLARLLGEMPAETRRFRVADAAGGSPTLGLDVWIGRFER